MKWNTAVIYKHIEDNITSCVVTRGNWLGQTVYDGINHFDDLNNLQYDLNMLTLMYAKYYKLNPNMKALKGLRDINQNWRIEETNE